MEQQREQIHRGIRQPALVAWLRLARAYQKLDRISAEHLREWGVSVAQFDLLAQIGAHEGSSQQELADRLLVTKGNISQMLDRLQARGLVSRQQDGRAARLFLTQSGRDLYEGVVPAQEGVIVERLSSLTHAEQQQLHDLLRKLDQSLP